MSIGEEMMERGANKSWAENPCDGCEINDCKSPDCPLDKLFEEEEIKK